VLTRPRGPVPLAYRALGHILDAASRRDLDAARGVVHVLPTPTTRAMSPIDFRHTPRLIDEGYRLAAAELRTRFHHSDNPMASAASSPPKPANASETSTCLCATVTELGRSFNAVSS
jgi:hypothetical protein